MYELRMGEVVCFQAHFLPARLQAAAALAFILRWQGSGCLAGLFHHSLMGAAVERREKGTGKDTRENKAIRQCENHNFIRYQLKSNGKDIETNRAESVPLLGSPRFPKIIKNPTTMQVPMPVMSCMPHPRKPHEEKKQEKCRDDNAMYSPPKNIPCCLALPSVCFFCISSSSARSQPR